MKKTAMLLILLSSPLHAQSFWGMGGSAVLQRTPSFGIFGQCSAIAFGGLTGIEFEAVDRKSQDPLYTTANGSLFSNYNGPTVPVGWEFILSASYCYQFSANFFAGAIVGVALKPVAYLVEPSHNDSWPYLQTASVWEIASGDPSTFVPNFGVEIKLLPITVEYSTEGGFGLGFEAKI